MKTEIFALEFKVAAFIVIAALVVAGLWFGIEAWKIGYFDELAFFKAIIGSIFIMNFGSLIKNTFLPKS